MQNQRVQGHQLVELCNFITSYFELCDLQVASTLGQVGPRGVDVVSFVLFPFSFFNIILFKELLLLFNVLIVFKFLGWYSLKKKRKNRLFSLYNFGYKQLFSSSTVPFSPTNIFILAIFLFALWAIEDLLCQIRSPFGFFFKMKISFKYNCIQRK